MSSSRDDQNLNFCRTITKVNTMEYAKMTLKQKQREARKIELQLQILQKQQVLKQQHELIKISIEEEEEGNIPPSPQENIERDLIDFS